MLPMKNHGHPKHSNENGKKNSKKELKVLNRLLNFS